MGRSDGSVCINRGKYIPFSKTGKGSQSNMMFQ